MATVRKDEIRGYIFCDGRKTEIVCIDCATMEDVEDLRREEVLDTDILENSGFKYFCDRCEKEI